MKPLSTSAVCTCRQSQRKLSKFLHVEKFKWMILPLLLGCQLPQCHSTVPRKRLLLRAPFQFSPIVHSSIVACFFWSPNTSTHTYYVNRTRFYVLRWRRSACVQWRSEVLDSKQTLTALEIKQWEIYPLRVLLVLLLVLVLTVIVIRYLVVTNGLSDVWLGYIVAQCTALKKHNISEKGV